MTDTIAPIKYVDLPEGAQEIIQTTKQRFEDAFDSDGFGPFIQNFKRYDDDRIAVLLDIAIGQLAMYVMMPVNWTVKDFPYKIAICRQGLILSLTIEIIQHLIRSYVEIPDVNSVGAPMAVRRDYLTRWKDALRDYQDMLKQMAKKLNAALYTAEAEAGMFQNVLMDFPSTTMWGWPVGYAEKEWYGYW